MTTPDRLTHQRLLELLHYDPETGAFTWRVHRQCVRAGSAAGHVNKQGYVRVVVEGKSRGGHRLAWFYVHGVWPTGLIDHKNRSKSENWINNLRDVTHAENMQNQVQARKRNRVGLAGVTPHGKKFQATARLNGERRSLGTFPTPGEAHQAYLDAKSSVIPQQQQ
jgi:hypothetical protein